jgi:hypothetical protein
MILIIVYRSDLIAATRFETMPHFPPSSLSPAALMPLSDFLPPTELIPFLIPKPNIMTPLGRSRSLGIIVISVILHELCYFLDVTASFPSPQSNQILLDACYHERVSAAEYQLVLLLQQHPAHTAAPDDISRVLTLAGLLHIYTCLRLTRSAVTIRNSLTERLLAALQNLTAPPPKIWRELLWICFLGWTTCAPEGYVWYSMRVKQLCELLELTTWEDVSSVLKRGVWIEKGIWATYEILWGTLQSTILQRTVRL